MGVKSLHQANPKGLLREKDGVSHNIMFVCLDLETTGLSAQDDHVIEVAIVRFDHEKILEEWSSLVNPGVPIPAFSAHLTGITNEMVKDAPKLGDLKETILEKLDAHPIMGHFIFFDVNFLKEKKFNVPNVQLDTCQLAQAFLHKEASYSLEVLTKKLGIAQEGAHRALNDVKANIELFWRFCEHVKALDKEQKSAIRPLFEKSDWPWAPFILPLLEEKGKNRIAENNKTNGVVSEKHADLKMLVGELNTPFLLEERSHTSQDLFDYALERSEKTLLVLPDPESLAPNKDLGVLKHPNQYLNEQRFADFISKDRLNPVETLLAVKIQLWLPETETGEKAEIRLQKEEKEMWFDLCCQEGEDGESFYQRAERAVQKKKVMAVSGIYFLKDRSRKDPLLSVRPATVIGEVGQFVKNMEEAWHIRLSESRFLQDLYRLQKENPSVEPVIDQLASKVSILFGFLGMFIKKEGEANNPHHTLTVEAHHLNAPEWNKVKGSAESIEAAAAALGESCKNTPTLQEFSRYLTYLTKILRMGSPVLWLSLSKEEQPIVHAFPDNPSELFSERVWKNLPGLHLFCHHGDLSDDFKFLKKELGLPSELVAVSKKEIVPLPLYYPHNPIKSPKDVQNLEEVVHELKEWLPSAGGNTLLLVNSMAVAEQFFYKFAKPIKAMGLTLFVQNLSGGMGKITKMAEKTDGKNFFVGNENLMEVLLEEGISIKLLALHRIPFASPADPIQHARSAFYTDSYKEFTLPQASLRYQNILNTFLGNAWDEKKILILDPRVKEYEGYFN